MEKYQCKYGHTEGIKVPAKGSKYCPACKRISSARSKAKRGRYHITRPHAEWTATFGEGICPIDGEKFTKRVVNQVYCDILCYETNKYRRAPFYAAAARAKQKQATLTPSRG